MSSHAPAASASSPSTAGAGVGARRPVASDSTIRGGTDAGGEGREGGTRAAAEGEGGGGVSKVLTRGRT